MLKQSASFVRTINIPQRVGLGPSLAAALRDELFEHSAEVWFCCAAKEFSKPTGTNEEDEGLRKAVPESLRLR
jgi:hypothetical protein